jgi:flagellar hook-associated protein 3 FlgL
MSTGKRVNRPSDDPIAASQAVVLSQAQSQNSQYALARLSPRESLAGRERVNAGDNRDPSVREKLVYASTAH